MISHHIQPSPVSSLNLQSHQESCRFCLLRLVYFCGRTNAAPVSSRKPPVVYRFGRFVPVKRLSSGIFVLFIHGVAEHQFCIITFRDIRFPTVHGIVSGKITAVYTAIRHGIQHDHVCLAGRVVVVIQLYDSIVPYRRCGCKGEVQ